MIKSVKQVKDADSFLTESAIYTGGDRKKKYPSFLLLKFYMTIIPLNPVFKLSII